jgi:hypothetical protein
MTCFDQEVASVPGASLCAYRAIALPWDARVLVPLVEGVVAEAEAGGVRRRLLPGAGVMVFVLGCCVFGGDCYGEVARKLAGWLGALAGPGRWRVPGSSALAKARRRLGARPFELLFARLAGPLAEPGTAGAWACGRRLLLMSVDGTMLDVPYTAANVAGFGPPPRSSRSGGGFPQVRLLTVIGCGTRGLAGAAFGPRVGPGSSEQALARRVAVPGVLGPGMLVLADRNFSGYPVVSAITGTGADVLIRVKSSQVLPVLEVLPDGSWLSVLPDPAAARRRIARNGARRRRGSALPPDTAPVAGIPVRVIEATVTACPAGGEPTTSTLRLITTLASWRDGPAAELAALYAQRWESETSYRELKHFLAGRVLRSKDPAGITQEIWALLCAGQLMQATRAAAAAAGGRLDPDQISWTVTVRAARRQITTSRPSRPGSRAALAEILSQLLPATRRQRSYPRLLHTSTAKRRQARAGLTATITYKITIINPSLPGP